MAPTLKDVFVTALCTRESYNNWRRRDILSKEDTLSRRSALEVTFLSALVSAGLDPQEAKPEVERWLREEAKHELAPGWIGNPRTRRGRGIGKFADATFSRLASETSLADEDAPAGWHGDAVKEVMPAAVLVFIDRAALVRRVDALFSKSGRKG